MSDISRKILVVDDDPGIRSQLKWGFDGYEVITADDRTHALEAFSKHHPPVVTLDLGLPPDSEGTREGLETLRQILRESPQTRVVVVSGSTDNTSASKVAECGAFGFMAKPVDITRLREVIEEAYQAYRAGRNQ